MSKRIYLVSDGSAAVNLKQGVVNVNYVLELRTAQQSVEVVANDGVEEENVCLDFYFAVRTIPSDEFAQLAQDGVSLSEAFKNGLIKTQLLGNESDKISLKRSDIVSFDFNSQEFGQVYVTINSHAFLKCAEEKALYGFSNWSIFF